MLLLLLPFRPTRYRRLKLHGDVVALRQLGGSYTRLVRGIGDSPGVDQETHHLQAIVLTRQVQRRDVEDVALVHVAAVLDEPLHRAQIPRAGG